MLPDDEQRVPRRKLTCETGAMAVGDGRGYGRRMDGWRVVNGWMNEWSNGQSSLEA